MNNRNKIILLSLLYPTAKGKGKRNKDKVEFVRGEDMKYVIIKMEPLFTFSFFL